MKKVLRSIWVVLLYTEWCVLSEHYVEGTAQQLDSAIVLEWGVLLLALIGRYCTAG